MKTKLFIVVPDSRAWRESLRDKIASRYYMGDIRVLSEVYPPDGKKRPFRLSDTWVLDEAKKRWKPERFVYFSESPLDDDGCSTAWTWAKENGQPIAFLRYTDIDTLLQLLDANAWIPSVLTIASPNDLQRFAEKHSMSHDTMANAIILPMS